MTAALDWMRAAKCAGIDGFTEMDHDDQMPVCGGCKVRGDCLDYALSTQQIITTHDTVTYAGMGPAELVREWRKRHPTTYSAACWHCGSGFETVKRGHYCSNTCRKAAHRARKAIA